MKKFFSLSFILALSFLLVPAANAAGPLLLQKPTLSKTHIAFAFAGDYDGNVDVYVIPAGGGVPKRLTHHPGVDEVIGWTPDGKQVLFRSGRSSYSRFNRLFTVSLDGGLPHELPLPMAEFGSYSPDGKHIAYVPTDNNRRLSAIGWKRYRGGKASHIWITNLSDYNTEQFPRDVANDATPMWVEGKIYFLSDRNGPFNLYVYDTKSKKIEPALSGNGADIKSASAGPGAIVYE